MENEYTNFWIKAVASRIEHSRLSHDTDKRAIQKLCDEAVQYGFKSVCVFPNQVQEAVKFLRKKPVSVCTVVGFPLGENNMRVKAFEAKDARYDGANEIDMVMTISAALEGDYRYIEKETAHVKRAISADMKLKVILETCLLTDAQIIKSAQAAARGGADFVKTSTGFAASGASAEKVRLIADALKNTKTQIKAAGGIKTLDDVVAMINAGATRIGTSHGIEIISTPVTREYAIENDFEKGLAVVDNKK